MPSCSKIFPNAAPVRHSTREVAREQTEEVRGWKGEVRRCFEETAGREAMKQLNDKYALNSARLSHIIYGDEFGEKEMTQHDTSNLTSPEGLAIIYANNPSGAHVPLFTISKAENTLFLTFRGTKTIIDWLIDFGAGRRWLDELGVYCHGGMCNILCDGSKSDTLNHISQKILNELENTEVIDTLVVTGHSLGGGYALIAAACFLGENRFQTLRSRLKGNILLRTFGAPQAMGVPEYSIKKPWWRELQRNAVNYVYNDDLVPRLSTPSWILGTIPDIAIDRMKRHGTVLLLMEWMLALRPENVVSWARNALMKHKTLYFSFQPVGRVVFLSQSKIDNPQVLPGFLPKDSDLHVFLAAGRGTFKTGCLPGKVLDAKDVLGWFPYQPDSVIRDHFPGLYVQAIELYDKWITESTNLHVNVSYGKLNNIIKMQAGRYFKEDFVLQGASARVLYFKIINDGDWGISANNLGGRYDMCNATVTQSIPKQKLDDSNLMSFSQMEYNIKRTVSFIVDKKKPYFFDSFKVNSGDLIEVVIQPRRKTNISLIAGMRNFVCDFEPYPNDVLMEQDDKKLQEIFRTFSKGESAIDLHSDEFEELFMAFYPDPNDYKFIVSKARRAGQLHGCPKCGNEVLGGTTAEYEDFKNYLLRLRDGPALPKNVSIWIEKVMGKRYRDLFYGTTTGAKADHEPPRRRILRWRL
eukprot:jgi/Bigna1/74983/fgenesh1_pg.32_\